MTLEQAMRLIAMLTDTITAQANTINQLQEALNDRAAGDNAGDNAGVPVLNGGS